VNLQAKRRSRSDKKPAAIVYLVAPTADRHPRRPADRSDWRWRSSNPLRTDECANGVDDYRTVSIAGETGTGLVDSGER
jgi:hypothetical protein